jgi:ERCC4-type nuclease
MASVVLLVDSREKRPLIFPAHVKWFDEKRKPHIVRLEVERATLSEGDYALKGHEDLVLVERKGSAQELWSNLLTKDLKRTRAAFRRLVDACKHPVLLMDFRFLDMASKNLKPEGLLPSAFLREVVRLGVHVMFTGSMRALQTRRQLGGFLASWMLEVVRQEGR